MRVPSVCVGVEDADVGEFSSEAAAATSLVTSKDKNNKSAGEVEVDWREQLEEGSKRTDLKNISSATVRVGALSRGSTARRGRQGAPARNGSSFMPVMTPA